MTRRLLAFALALCACAPPVLPTPDAQPDVAAEAAADAHSAPDAEPAMDARADVDAVVLLDAQPEANPPDATDAGSATDARADAAARPDINTRHDTMTVTAALRLTCAPGMGVGAPDYCNAVKTVTFEGGCSVRGTRSQVGFSPFSCGIRCYSIGALVDGAFTSVTVDAAGSIASGTNVWMVPGLEWVDGLGQRRQNFYVRVQMDPNVARDVRGIAGVPGITDLPEYADIYALGCPKGP